MPSAHAEHWWRRLASSVRAVETCVLVALLGGLIVLGVAQIVLRNAFSVGLPWADGVARLTVLWLALLGALAASRDGRHITMSGLTHWLPAQWRRVLTIVADVLAACVCAFLARYAFAFVRDSRAFGDLLLDTIPAWWLQAIMPLAFGLMALEFLGHGLRRIFAAREDGAGRS